MIQELIDYCEDQLTPLGHYWYLSYDRTKKADVNQGKKPVWIQIAIYVDGDDPVPEKFGFKWAPGTNNDHEVFRIKSYIAMLQERIAGAST